MKCSFHKYTAVSLMCAVGFLMSGAAAFAQSTVEHESARRAQNQDEYGSRAPNQSTSTTSTSKSSPSKHQVMNDCVAASEQGMTKTEAKKACHDALKPQSDNQDNEPRPH